MTNNSTITVTRDAFIKIFQKKYWWFENINKLQNLGLFLVFPAVILFFIEQTDYFVLLLKMSGLVYLGTSMILALYLGAYKQDYFRTNKFAQEVQILTGKSAVRWGIIQFLLRGIILIMTLTIDL